MDRFSHMLYDGHTEEEIEQEAHRISKEETPGFKFITRQEVSMSKVSDGLKQRIISILTDV